MNNNILKPVPEFYFEEKKALVILATQRSGSTMLCKDIEETKVLGTPDEHFWRCVVGQPDEKAGEDLQNLFIQSGNMNGSDFFSIKLMYNYLDLFGYWVSDRSEELNQGNEETFRNYALDFFLKRFEEVTFVYLTREDKFEQALSHYRAKKTNTWHVINDETIKGALSNDSIDEGELLFDIDVALFNLLYETAKNEDRKLESLLNEKQIKYLPLVYEEIRNNYPSYLMNVGEKAGAVIDPKSLPERKIKKIISNDFINKFKERL